jgi:hypothetical protein
MKARIKSLASKYAEAYLYERPNNPGRQFSLTVNSLAVNKSRELLEPHR